MQRCSGTCPSLDTAPHLPCVAPRAHAVRGSGNARPEGLAQARWSTHCQLMPLPSPVPNNLDAHLSPGQTLHSFLHVLSAKVGRDLPYNRAELSTWS